MNLRLISLLVILSCLFFGFVWADNNGVWHLAEDVRPGIFGHDEGLSSGFSFVNPVTFNENVVVNNHNFIVNNGNVGIGVASPSYKLDVLGNIRSSGEIVSTSANSFRSIAGSYGTIFRNDGTNTYILITDASDQYGTWNGFRPFRINNALGHVYLGADALTVLHGGNVGIGNVNPTYKLDVTGSVRASGDIVGNRVCVGTDCRSVWPEAPTISYAAGTKVIAREDTEKTNYLGTYTTSSEFVALTSGVLRVSFEHKKDSATGAAYSRIVKFNPTTNVETVVGGEWSAVNSYTIRTADITVETGDVIRIQQRTNQNPYFPATYRRSYVRNVRISADSSASLGVAMGLEYCPCGVCWSIEAEYCPCGGYGGGSLCTPAGWRAIAPADCSGCTCLVAGTHVLMADESFRNIEDVNAGDYVINQDGDSSLVVDLWRTIIGDRNTYVINDNVEVTPDHPFMTTDGWKVISLDMLKRTQDNSDLYQGIVATELVVGDVLITKNGEEVVRSIEENTDRLSEEEVYSLILENSDSFYANDYLVAGGR